MGYKAEKFEDAAHDIDIVLDTVGGETQGRSFTTMKTGGTLVATTAPPDREAAARAGVTAQMIQMDPSRTQLGEIGRLMDAGKFQVRIGLVLLLPDARQAQEKGEAGGVRGRIVLRMPVDSESLYRAGAGRADGPAAFARTRTASRRRPQRGSKPS